MSPILNRLLGRIKFYNSTGLYAQPLTTMFRHTRQMSTRLATANGSRVIVGCRNRGVHPIMLYAGYAV